MVALLKTNTSQSQKEYDFVNILVACVGSSIGLLSQWVELFQFQKVTSLILNHLALKHTLFLELFCFFGKKTAEFLIDVNPWEHSQRNHQS